VGVSEAESLQVEEPNKRSQLLAPIALQRLSPDRKRRAGLMYGHSEAHRLRQLVGASKDGTWVVISL
jgi:hypothetical protein